MTRASPYRHPVRSHVRQGARVDRYERGEGKKPAQPRRVLGERSLGGARWRVSRGGSSVTVSAADIVSALRRGIDSLPAGETVTVNRI